MVALCRYNSDNGFVSAAYEPVALIEQGQGFAVTDVSWTVDRTQGLDTPIQILMQFEVSEKRAEYCQRGASLVSSLMASEGHGPRETYDF